MKASYIEREAAILAHNLIYNDLCQNIRDCINTIPAADVRPVVRGRWMFEKGDGQTCSDGWVCSACNYGFHTNVPYFEDFNFCPNCGAIMDGGPEE